MAYFRCSTGSASSGDGVALVVQCDANFAGSVITATNGTDTFTETCPSVSPYTVRFEGIPTGTYTISGVSQGQTFTTQFTVLDYETTLNATPEGATVLPINDIQIWLNCANIYDKTYTTLDEVLADNTTLLALISDENAVDYMVRSTEWSGLELIPIMTSNTAPSGECIYSTQNSNGNAYLAFDGNASTFWSPSSMSNAWVGYKFTNAICAKKAVVKNNQAATISIDASNDLSTWTTLKSNISVTHAIMTEIDLSDNETAYLAYRVRATGNTNGIYVFELYEGYSNDYITTNQTAMGYIGNNDYAADTLLADATWCEAICNSEYFESVLNVKVPTMTSATTPSGECFGSSKFNDPDYTYYGAFNSSNVFGWRANGYTNEFLGYKFTSARKVNKFEFTVRQSNCGPQHVQLQGSNDFDIWDNIGTSQSVQNVASVNQSYNVVNTTAYLYYRFLFPDVYSSQVNVIKCQFYGR